MFKFLMDALTSLLTFIHLCDVARHLFNWLQDSHNYLHTLGPYTGFN